MNLAERICQMDETEITTEVLTTIEESDIPDVPLEERRKKKDKEDWICMLKDAGNRKNVSVRKDS